MSVAPTAGGMPEGISVSDAGFFLFDRKTGVPEMFESERTVELGDRREYERTRMRLLGGAHAHAWAEEAGAATGD